MELPVQITYRNMEPSPAITARIEEEAAKLDSFYPRIVRCRVVVEAPHRHHRLGEQFQVRIHLTVPRGELVVSHDPSLHSTATHDESIHMNKHLEFHPDHKDVYVAIRDSFISSRRQLQDYAARIRGEIKHHEAA